MKRLLIAISCFISASVYSQSITNTLGTNGLFTIKDTTNNYLTVTQLTGQVNILNSLRLENTTSSTTGVIFKGTDPFLHNFGIQNTFLGVNSGNFTMFGIGGNVAFGNYSFFSNTTGAYNSAFGLSSLQSNTTGNYNSAFGYSSLRSNTTGIYNSAFGFQSLYNNSTGVYNSAFGHQSLLSNTTGAYNSAFGYESLLSNTTGNENSAFGLSSLYSNTTGSYNSAFGRWSLVANTTGNYNSAFGYYSLNSNTMGSLNSAFGVNSLFSNTGDENSAFGTSSLSLNTTGNENTAVGFQSLFSNTVNSGNTAVGWNSLVNSTGSQNTAVGHHSLNLNTTGNYNTALGYNSGSTITTGYNLTCLGTDAAPSSPTAIDQITLGNIYVTSLRCNVQTISSLSDARDKKNITDLTLGLDFLMKVKPRQFNWDKREWYEGNKSDGSKMKETFTAGFISQELDEAQTTENADWLNLVLKDNPEKLEATYGNLLPVMVKAIQELKEENDLLKERLSAMEQKISMETPAKLTSLKITDPKTSNSKSGEEK